ncbi:MAG: bifunctional lysine ketoglutarate reductase /saccharopine dehydrogenase family protein [Candidatus Bipolaricaulota bacterium]
MSKNIGIKKEKKNKWEKRTPLVPSHVAELSKKFGIGTVVESSSIRVFEDEEYENAGAEVVDELSDAPVVFAIKEIDKAEFEPNSTYLFFSHTIKGQEYNMPMLKALMDKGCQLIDYETITDQEGKRLLAFGRYAGLAGMIDSLWSLGQRLAEEGIDNPFAQVKRAHEYRSLFHAKEHILNIGQQIKTEGLDPRLVPFNVGVAGYGHVSGGAQEILNLLPVMEIEAQELLEMDMDSASNNYAYKVVFKEGDMVEPISEDQVFELGDYYSNPEKYRSRFADYLPRLSLLINAIYWEEKYPRLVTKEEVSRLYSSAQNPKLKVIGDISCDIEGAIEITVQSTDPGDPVFVYNPETGDITSGYQGKGPVVMAVDNLPCEFPADSSTFFSEILKQFVPHIVEAEYSQTFEDLDLPPPVKRAVILHRGELTPNYEYLSQYV